MMRVKDLDSTIEILENNNWGDPPIDATNLVRKCHELRRKQLKDFDVEDLRLLIGQQIGLAYLVPMVLKVLEKDVLAEGDFFEGDLLSNLLWINQDHWKENPDQLSSVIQLFLSNQDRINNELNGSILRKIIEGYERLTGRFGGR